MNLYSELCVAKWYDFGCNCWDREGRINKKVTPIIVPFSVSVLAVVTK